MKNIRKAYDFSLLDDLYVRKHFSIVEVRLKKELEGISQFEMEVPQNKKNIATTRTFEKMLSNFEEINERLATFTMSAAEKLRKQKSSCNFILVFVETNRHRKDMEQYRQSTLVKIPYATNSSFDLVKAAKMGLKSIFKEGYAYKRAGISLMGIVEDNQKQLDLFLHENPKHLRLMQVMDQMNLQYGEQKLKMASQDLTRTWKMKQARLSPRYTTKINEILIVKV